MNQSADEDYKGTDHNLMHQHAMHLDVMMNDDTENRHFVVVPSDCFCISRKIARSVYDG
jgi:hypothetical protein